MSPSCLGHASPRRSVFIYLLRSCSVPVDRWSSGRHVGSLRPLDDDLKLRTHKVLDAICNPARYQLSRRLSILRDCKNKPMKIWKRVISFLFQIKIIVSLLCNRFLLILILCYLMNWEKFNEIQQQHELNNRGKSSTGEK